MDLSFILIIILSSIWILFEQKVDMLNRIRILENKLGIGEDKNDDKEN
ncbi:hypothetical protein KAU33_00950 [Candidatus Dependentiae bacterium]|nr:hypothetical protein [Candidatus Dependentiae bacterium]